VVYRASADSKNRSRVTKRLRALGCEQMHRSFWKVNKENVYAVSRLLEGNHPIILKRVREVRKPVYDKRSGKLCDPGSLIIIAYRSLNETDRVKVKNFLKRAPYIRLCRGVYAFSHWHERFDKRHELVNATDFWEFIQKVDEKSIIIPRVIIVNTESVDMILEEVKNRVKKEIDKIAQTYLNSYQKMNFEVTDQSFITTSQKLKKRFTTIRKVAIFYKKWLRVDFSGDLIKIYRVMKRVNSLNIT